MEESQNEKPNCPTNCPNRQKNGITLNFGKHSVYHIDIFEIVIWLFIATSAGINLRDAWGNKLTFRESMERIAMLAAVGSVARMSPTDQISEFLSKFYVGKKQ